MRIAVFTLGGTIAMTRGPDGDLVVPGLTADDLVAGVTAAGITVETHDFRLLSSSALGFADLAELAVAASAEVAGGVHGVVVAQGTDSLEETAFLLDLLWPGEAPLVLTGAMRNPTLAGPDGPANLLAAIQVAASGAARGLGVLVVLADEVHAARWVRKTHATSTATFRSPDTGPVGLVVEGRPSILTRPVRPAPDLGLDPAALAFDGVRTAVVPVVLGDDGELLNLLVRKDSGFDGLVVAGFGAGHVPPATIGPLTELAARIPVVLAGRTGAGPTLTSTYAYPGSESDLLGRGLIGAGLLDQYKARILLHTLLAAGRSRTDLEAGFALMSGRA
jgi:L-asparaginase